MYSISNCEIEVDWTKQVNNGMKKYCIIILSFITGACSYNSFEELVDCTLSDFTIEVGETTNADCGVENGSVTINTNGGLAPFVYSINDGNSQTENIFTDLNAGNHFVKAIDSNGCEIETEFVIDNNEGVMATLSSTVSGCGDTQGSIAIAASNGVEPYSYQIDNGAGQIIPVFADLGQGQYEIAITDVNGCQIIITAHVSSGVSFVQSVSPIISTNCAISGCHGGTQFPDFRVFENIQNNASEIRIRTQNRIMPLTGSLTQNEIDLIACWVDDGALNN